MMGAQTMKDWDKEERDESSEEAVDTDSDVQDSCFFPSL